MKKRCAVCFSGQPRTWKSLVYVLKKYFSNDGYEFDFFIHSYNYNTYKNETRKLITEVLDVDIVRNELSIAYSPKGIIVDHDSTEVDVAWHSLFKSMYNANQLKKEYENLHNFKYDLVIKTRLDMYFEREFFIEPKIDTFSVYTQFGDRMKAEFNKNNFNDTYIFGDSISMDILCDVYKYYQNIHEYYSFTEEESIYTRMLGPGVRIYDYSKAVGLAPAIDKFTFGRYNIIRKKCENMDPRKDFEQIFQYMIRTL